MEDRRPLQPKTKRRMTKEEKVAYKTARKRGACSSCRHKKAKCTHVGDLAHASKLGGTSVHEIKQPVLEEIRDNFQSDEVPSWPHETSHEPGWNPRGRKTTPEPYEDNEWARSQSPAGSLYSDDGRVTPGPYPGGGGSNKLPTLDQQKSVNYNASSPPPDQQNFVNYDASAPLFTESYIVEKRHQPLLPTNSSTGQHPSSPYQHAINPLAESPGMPKLERRGPAPVKRRVSRACDHCYRMRTRCNGQSPCSRCVELEHVCQYQREKKTYNRKFSYQQSGSGKIHNTFPKQQYSQVDHIMGGTEEWEKQIAVQSEVFQRERQKQLESEDIRRQQVSDRLEQDIATHKLPAYRYTPITSSEVRLLRIDPGVFAEPLVCALKHITVEKIRSHVLTFQALSYAWGKEESKNIIAIADIRTPTTQSEITGLGVPTLYSFFVQRNLFQALMRIRHPHEYVRLFADAVCIVQGDETDKSQQIPNMPDIYSNAWNVILWLGEGESEGWDGENDTQRAVDLIPKILNLRMLDELLDGSLVTEEALRSWHSFGHFLRSPWFSRRWVIQEIACAGRLSIRIRHHIISWLDFTDAIDVCLHNLGRIRHLLTESSLPLPRSHSPSSAECSRAMALMELSSSCFQRAADLRIKSRLLSLETLVLAASSFAVSEVRDTIYALLYLASDREAIPRSHGPIGEHHVTLSSDYSRHAVDIFTDFVTYCIGKSKTLDIIYQPWAMWPRSRRAESHNNRRIPSWVGVASFGDDKAPQRLSQSHTLTGPPKHPLYSASRGTTIQASITYEIDLPVLRAKGVILGTVCETSALRPNRIVTAEALGLLGWTGGFEDGVDDKLWKTLTANRTPLGTKAPAWYRRACALALTKLNGTGDLDIPALTSSTGEASAMVDYLQRVHAVFEGRKIFRCKPEEAEVLSTIPSHNEDGFMVGLGPHNLQASDVVCILFGCSVPVVLRRAPLDVAALQSFQLIGACYMHGHMEGEGFVGANESDIDDHAVEFRIY